MQEAEDQLGKWTAEMYQPADVYEEMFGSEKKQLLNTEDLDFGAE